MFVYIKTLTNKYKLNVAPEDTILHLKYQIEETLQILVKQQRLIFNGYTMVDENTLEQSGVKENSVIHLVFCMM
jgi:hypothetical protein